MMKTGIMFVLIIICVAGFMQIDDNGAEIEFSNSLKDSQKAAQVQERKELAALAVCQEKHGQSVPKWSDDGSMRCVTKKGRAL